MIHDWKVSFTQ